MSVFSARSLSIALAAAIAPVVAGAADAPAYPPAHPYASSSPWPLGFNGPFAQQSTPRRGPRPGDELSIDFVGREAAGPLPSGLAYSAPYENGGEQGVYNTYWTNGRDILKIIRTRTTLEKADSVSQRVFKFGDGLRFVSGYWLPDGAAGAYVIIGDELAHFVDAVAGDPRSKVAEAQRLSLKPAFKAAGEGRRRPLTGDLALGLQRLYGGDIALTTLSGSLCAVDAALTPSKLSCVDVLQSDADGESLRNSISAEPGPEGADDIYLTSTKAVFKYRFDRRSRTFARVWSVNVDGSGSTPTLMGIGSNEDRLVLVTTFPGSEKSPVSRARRGDGAYELVAIWRDDRPPSGGGRIAGRVALTFGLPPERQRKLKPTQNSVAVRGYRTVIPNFNGIYAYAEPADASVIGVEAFDWDPVAKRLKSAWLNQDIYVPNSMAAISAPPGESGLVYAIGLREFQTTDRPARRAGRRRGDGGDAPLWTLEALDLDTGRSIASWPIGRGKDWNVNGSGVQIGPDSEIITSGSRGVYRLSPNSK